MSTQVRTCPKCFRLMWLTSEHYEMLDDATIRAKCPHCQSTVRFKLITQGETAAGPKMGH